MGRPIRNVPNDRNGYPLNLWRADRPEPTNPGGAMSM